MSDRRFSSMEDGELADVWYALGGAAVRHSDHFQPLYDAAFAELLERRGEEGLNPWLEQRFREFRLVDSRDDARATPQSAIDSSPSSASVARGDELPPVPDVGVG